jgi:ribosomal protein S18 acetylase RimI-like enzyme
VKKGQTHFSDVTFCLGTAVDAAALAEFAARTFEETYSADNSAEDTRAHLSATYGLKQQTAELVDPSVSTILARSNTELIAYAQIRRNAPPPCVTHPAPIQLHRFYVDRRAHGSGLASELMQAVHQAAHDFDGGHIWLSVWERNPRAIAFYEKARFVDVGSTIYMVGPDSQVDRVLVASVCPQGQNTP